MRLLSRSRSVQIPKLRPSDWNDLAWITIFTGENADQARSAAEKAAQMTNFQSPAVLQTLAISQAADLHFKDARATGYVFANLSGDSGEMNTIFGRIAEQLGLPEVALDYYRRVPKQDDSLLSNYSLAQERIKNVNPQIEKNRSQ